ncbi:SLC13 family permease [Thermococcus sibiricus]|uniref:Transport protein n=1 Tax=Thermococcus sibiricus TaxID=172049 RepID=A0A117L142_9EURY|nr:SLC13 family permease [Thermococcus sibiricus]KUK16806.1 MAG: Transport protein [Thermococcus sibiricus]
MNRHGSNHSCDGINDSTWIVGGLIARSRKPHIPVWAIMAAASTFTVLTGLEPLGELDKAIDLDVVLFLVGMFSLVGLTEESGLLKVIVMKLISWANTTRGMLVYTSLVMGLLAAFAVNDTVALMGPPMVRAMAKITGLNPVPLFLILAFSITIGSTMTPMGNPQNLLIAMQSGISAPFMKFMLVLTIPTILNLVLTPLVVMRIYNIENREFKGSLIISEEHLTNKRDAVIAAVFFTVTVAILVVNDVLEIMGFRWIEHRGFIPFIMASLAYILSSNPRAVLNRVDWGTIIFFITMFITMDGVWRSGLLQKWLLHILPGKPESLVAEFLILTVISLLLSQVLSNVPFVKLFIDYLKSIGYNGEDVRA